MTFKEIGNYRFDIKPSGLDVNCYSFLAAEPRETFSFVGMNEANALLKKHGERIRQEGCKSLYGASGRYLWRYDLDSSEGWEYTEATLSAEDPHIFGESKGNGDWFVTRPMISFDHLELKLNYCSEKPESFFFAVVRGDLSDLAPQFMAVSSDGLAVGDFAFAQRLPEALRHCDISPAIFWENAEERFGPLRAIAGVDLHARQLFGGIPLMSVASYGAQGPNLLRFDRIATHTDPHDVWAYLVPLRGTYAKAVYKDAVLEM